MNALNIALFITTAHCPIFANEYISQETGEDCTPCTSYQTKAEQLYSQQNYKEAIGLAQLCFNRLELKINKVLDTLYNSIALSYLKLGRPLKSKAHLALADPQDKKTIFNQTLVQNKIPQRLNNGSVAGAYWQYAEFSKWSVINTSPANDSLWNITYHGLYITNPCLGGVNSGDLTATLPIKNNQMTYTNIHSKNYLNCSILLEFNKNTLLTTTGTEKSNCGFGHNVFIGRTYQRVEP